MQKRTLARQILALLLALLIIFGAVNLFWYGFRYRPYRQMTAQMQLNADSERPRYIGTDGTYLFLLKMPGYLTFKTGFLYVVEEAYQDAAAFVADENGNLTEQNIPHVDMFIWPQMFSPAEYRVTIYEETDSVWAIMDSRGEFLPDETLSDAENARVSALFDAHRSEIQEMLRAAAAFWGDGLK